MKFLNICSTFQYLYKNLYRSLFNNYNHGQAAKFTAAAAFSTSRKPVQNTNPQNLPHLPVPKLEQTLEKFLVTVQPLLKPDELEKTKCVVQDFQKGIGSKLQTLLVEKAKNTENWLADWWLNVAYLEYRDPVVVYSSPGLVFPFQNFENECDQLEYTAKLILAAIDYKLLIDRLVVCWMTEILRF